MIASHARMLFRMESFVTAVDHADLAGSTAAPGAPCRASPPMGVARHAGRPRDDRILHTKNFPRLAAIPIWLKRYQQIHVTTRRANHFALSEACQPLPPKIFFFRFSETYDHLS